MRIGIDIDGTITDAEEFFGVLTHTMVTLGHEVHIITFREDTLEEIKEELKGCDIKYTAIHLPNPEDKHDTWKGKLAEKLKLDIMFDDSPEVLHNMPKSVKRFWLCDPEIFNLKEAVAGMRAGMRIETIK